MPKTAAALRWVDSIRQVLLGTHGLQTEAYDAVFMAKTIDKRVAASGMNSRDQYSQFLATQREEAETLIASLSVPYSEFFRNSLSFALLEQVVLPRIIDKRVAENRPEIRIWSAGCAAGQEAWSVAMLLHEILASRCLCIPFRIFATDISESELDKAKIGSYSAYGLGNVRMRYLEQYFIQSDDRYTIIPELRQHVAFSRYDLLDSTTNTPPSSIFGDFDLILCNNVLLYYRVEMQYVILNKLRNGMLPHGYLVTDETTRRTVDCVGGFRAVAPPAMVFRRAAKKV